MKTLLLFILLATFSFGQHINPTKVTTGNLNNFQYVKQGSTVQAAVDALPASGGTVLVPPGYIETVTSPWTIGSASKVVTLNIDKSAIITFNVTGGVDAIQLYSKSSIVSEGTNSLTNQLILASTANVNNFLASYPRTGGSIINIRGITIQGHASATIAGAIVDLQSVTDSSTFQNMVIGQCPNSYCLRIQNDGVGGASGPINFIGVTVNGNALTGAKPVQIKAQSTSGVVGTINFFGGSLTHPGTGGLAIVDIQGGTNNMVQGVTFVGTQFESSNTGDIGVNVVNASGLNMIDTLFTASTNAGTSCVKFAQSGGGVTQNITIDNLNNFNSWTNSIEDGINTVNITDVRVGRYTYLPTSPAGKTYVYGENGLVQSVSNTGMTTKALNNIQFADQFPGGDCGAKINAADTVLGASAGEIWINQACGTSWTTAVTISANHILRFIQGGTYQSSAQITLNNGTTVIGTGRGNVAGDAPPTMLQEANSANLATFINASGTGVRIENIYIDGNKANNATAQDGVVAGNAKFKMSNVAVDNFKRHNIVLGASTQETKLDGITTANAGTNNIEIQTGATDMTFDNANSENPGQYALHASGTVGGIHINGGDYSSSTGGSSDCIFLDGTGGQIYPVQIDGIQINPCQGNGINGINLSNATITGSTIGQVGQGLVTDHRDAIRITNNGHATITGNSIIDGAGTPSMVHCVNITAETHTNSVVGNKCYINSTATALWVLPSTDTFIGNPTENSSGKVAAPNMFEGLPIPQIITTTLTTTAATTDNVTVTGMTSTGHCSLIPTNSGAAGGIASVYVSNKTTNQITVTHTATSGWTFDVICFPQ